MNKNTYITKNTTEDETKKIFIFIMLLILSLITIFFLTTKNMLILFSYFFIFNFCEIYYSTKNIEKKDIIYSLIKILIQMFIYTLLFKILTKNNYTNNSFMTFYILMILPIYFSSFVYFNLKDKKIAIQDKIYKSIKDIPLYKKENIKFLILFMIFYILNKFAGLKISGVNLKLVNNLIIFSYIIITTITLYLILKISKEIKIYKGENYNEAES